MLFSICFYHSPRRNEPKVTIYESIHVKTSLTRGIITGLLVMMIMAAGISASGVPESKGKRIIEPFNYQGVTLGGSLRRQFDEVCEYYLRIPNDDLLKPYRQRAEKSAPGVDLGGCYISHNPFGQLLSGYARMYAATGNRVYKNKAIALMNGWAECIEPDGFFFIEKNPHSIPYCYEKIVGGLLDIYTYCGDKAALNYLKLITNWAILKMSRVHQYTNPNGNDRGEWYTLSENLYRAYLLSGDTKYRDFAEVWEYKEYWNLFSKGKDIDIFTKPDNYHASSHVNTFNSLASAYAVKGNPAYLKTLRNAYEYMQENQCWATGGYGPNESLMRRDGLVKALSESTNHFETQCGSWAGFKMTKSLISFTGDASYGDWTERLLLNGIGASIPMDGAGRVFYNSEYNISGSAKRNITDLWSCCSGTRPQAVSDYHDLIYFKDADNLYVNLFTESSIEWNRKNGKIVVSQNTNFPESNSVEWSIAASKPTQFGMLVRVPAWLAGPIKASINGKEVAVKINSRHWAVFTRIWKNGDKLAMKFPMKLWISRIDPAREYPAAIMYGPVVLAVRSLGKNSAERIDLVYIKAVLSQSQSEPLTWYLTSNPAVLIRPFYVFKEGERYFLYLDPSK